jgi:hypothetical protein
MSVTNILQRRIKAKKDDSDDEEPDFASHESESESESELAKLGAYDGFSSADSSEGGECQEQQQQEGKNANGVSDQTVRNNFLGSNDAVHGKIFVTVC